jgi:hypothetical protein
VLEPAGVLGAGALEPPLPPQAAMDSTRVMASRILRSFFICFTSFNLGEHFLSAL